MGTPQTWQPKINTHQVRTAVTPWYSRTIVRVLLIIAALGIIGVCAGIMLLIMGVELGPNILLLAAVFAAIPVPVLLLALLWLDRFEPEPWHYLAFAFGWGAFVATAVAIIINSTSVALSSDMGRSEPTKTVAIFVAPPVEEIAKAAPLFILLALTLLGRRHIHGIVDGIVYAGFAAVGFAFTENILYFGHAYVVSVDEGRDGFAALFLTFFFRAIVSPFAHPMFTALTGIGVGIAVRSNKWPIKILAPIGGLLCAIGLHSLWNYFATTEDLTLMLGAYLAIMLPAFIGLCALAIWLRAREGAVTTRILPAYVKAGWLTTSEVASLARMRDRLKARDWARTYGGSTGAKAMQQFQLAATRLAILRDEAWRGIIRDDFTQYEQELLATMTDRRNELIHNASLWNNALRHSPYATYVAEHHHSHYPHRAPVWQGYK